MNSLAKAGALVAAVLTADWALAASVSLEIASERGTQITAPQEWLQLLRRVGVTSVRIRGARTGDTPSVEAIGDGERPAYRMVGVLTSRGELRLPGGRFTRRDEPQLRNYFDRLDADGAESLTQVTGNFGLTREQFDAVFEQLKQPLAAATKGESARSLIDRMRPRLAMRVVIDPRAAERLAGAGDLDADLGGLTIGAALAIALRGEGLALTPAKPRGRPVELRVVAPTEGQETWPIGYKAEGPPRNTAPGLMRAITVEIDGFTLAEAVAAVAPRLELPVIWDRDALRRNRIDPAAIQVKLPRAKLSYKRILEKLLFQARLYGELRVDEAGAPFYWISKR